VPPTIQQIIELQTERCSRQEKRLLRAASVVGVDFSAVAAAAALGEKADRIETRCRGLAHRHLLIEPANIRQLPGGKRQAHYRFSHVLYQNICYQLLLQRALKNKTSGKVNLKFAEVESCFEQAITIARQQHAKSFELRATTSLARLLQRRNRQAEARERLTNIYHWFTEGHDTVDLREARELLQTLSALPPWTVTSPTATRIHDKT
jgi:predicted ATPase